MVKWGTTDKQPTTTFTQPQIPPCVNIPSSFFNQHPSIQPFYSGTVMVANKPSMMGNKRPRYQCTTQEGLTDSGCGLHTNTHWQSVTQTAALTLQDVIYQSLVWSGCQEASRGHEQPVKVQPGLTTTGYYWQNNSGLIYIQTGRMNRNKAEVNVVV